MVNYQISKKRDSLAPIILFVFNRPKHTLETLEALSRNELANQSTLYIFADGYNENATEKIKTTVKQVRAAIKSKQWCENVVIKEADSNNGLANSVISGVTETIRDHGKVIVLEDDLIPSRFFLKYMNEALDLYDKSENVFQISGYNFPVKGVKAEYSSYFLPFTSTWGWATWKRAWDKIDFECKDYGILIKDRELAHRFNFNGAYNYTKMFVRQMESEKISSWGIRFYWNIFKEDALILFPDKSLILNKGWDNTGRHGDNYNIFPMDDWDDNYQIKSFPGSIEVDRQNAKLIASYIRKRTSFKVKALSTLINFLRN